MKELQMYLKFQNALSYVHQIGRISAVFRIKDAWIYVSVTIQIHLKIENLTLIYGGVLLRNQTWDESQGCVTLFIYLTFVSFVFLH